MNNDSNPLENISSPTSIPDTPACDVDDILTLQTRKAELVQERDALAQKRIELKQTIERLSISLSHYKKQQLQYETKQKLEYYLHQNDHECAKLSRPDNAASFVLKNLNVLPTTDVNLRMKLIDRFYPTMIVSHESVSTIYEGEELFTVINFHVCADGIPPLKIRLFIKDDTVHRVELLEYDQVAHLFEKISSSFCNTLIRNYCRLNKIDLILYSYHSLSQLQQIRIASLSHILQKYSEFVTRPVSWTSDSNSFLMSLSYIELTITEKLKNEKFKIKLQWNIVFENTAIGEVESQLIFSVQKDNACPLNDANDVFLTLVSEHGIVNAFSLMLLNLFGV
ncbi:hypothetical protein JCM33374_g5092 [Metschnikowia sp. JCM 33374]|nr:hypothetical protein JCM33374_g5092 [Metschnikowia sp. JCM 33374]